MWRTGRTGEAVPSSVVGRITGEAFMGKYTGAGVSDDAIARRAFELWERRGRPDGHDVDDWLSAERELTRRDARS
jgi:hypothetical protein